VIESNRTGKQQIYIISASTGTLVRRVTNNAGEDDSPAWSHDGGRITYVSIRGGVAGVYTIGATGRAERRLTVGVNYFHPTWSPDDRWIMYNVNSRAHPDTYELYAMHADGSAAHAITHNNSSETTYGSWSPDGAHVIYRWKFPPYRSQIYIANADGSNQRNLSNNGYYDGWPSWSPDGHTIVFASNRLERDRASLNEQIFLMESNGSHVRLLAANGGRNVEPRFSPDGKYVYFSHCVHHRCEAYRSSVPTP
jgi:TolB protein